MDSTAVDSLTNRCPLATLLCQTLFSSSEKIHDVKTSWFFAVFRLCFSFTVAPDPNDNAAIVEIPLLLLFPF